LTKKKKNLALPTHCHFLPSTATATFCATCHQTAITPSILLQSPSFFFCHPVLLQLIHCHCHHCHCHYQTATATHGHNLCNIHPGLIFREPPGWGSQKGFEKIAAGQKIHHQVELGGWWGGSGSGSGSGWVAVAVGGSGSGSEKKMTEIG
jgi:hypothetical protein